MRAYFEKYGDTRFRAVAAEIEKGWDSAIQSPVGDEPEPGDDFAAAGIRKVRDIAHVFSKNLYFGCEADDRMTAVAFDPRINHRGIQLKAMLGSDIGHWDVTDMAAMLVEAYELVEDGLLTADNFRAFSFGNVVELHASMNPRFFAGTVVEDAVNRAGLGAADAA